jgi:decaprenyl-phosphate phosphoribosyltransferase
MFFDHNKPFRHSKGLIMTVIPLIRLMRPHQWIKNFFVLAPLFFTPSALNSQSVLMAVAGFLCFCLISSSIYIVNDYADVEKDRLHPTKKFRPLAAGLIGNKQALSLATILVITSVFCGLILNSQFAIIMIMYGLLNVGYSFSFKHIPIIDVFCIALGFVFRVEAGSCLINITPSVWILLCTGLLALFLGLSKRRDDVVHGLDDTHRKALQGYNLQFIDQAIGVSLTSVIICYIMYTTDSQVMARLGTDQLYTTIPFVMIGVFRYLQIVFVDQNSGSPTKIVLKDRMIQACVVAWAVLFAVLIYV